MYKSKKEEKIKAHRILDVYILGIMFIELTLIMKTSSHNTIRKLLRMSIHFLHRQVLFHKFCPQLRDPGSLSRQHTVLKTVKILPVDRWHKSARDQAEEDSRRKVMLPDAVAELEILVEHCTEWEWNRLGIYVSLNAISSMLKNVL